MEHTDLAIKVKELSWLNDSPNGSWWANKLRHGNIFEASVCSINNEGPV